MVKVSEHIKAILATLPVNPGVYRYYDKDGEIIYVGKAKNLKRRVSSYFNKEQSGKTRLLVSRIADVKFIVVDSESEALLLENNLIKEYKPRFNVMLKDDKTYPWICIKKEAFPRVFLTRKKIDDGSEYFGPYPSVRTAHILLDLLRQAYHVRSCKTMLTPTGVAKGKYKVCLDFHIHKCDGPCEGFVTQDEYLNMVSEIREIIKGNMRSVLKVLKDSMMEYASRMEFEKAHLVKEKYDLLENYRSRSTVVSATIHDADVFSFVDAQELFYVNYMRVVDGAVIHSHTIEMKRKLDEDPDELLLLAVTELRRQFQSPSPEIIVPVKLDYAVADVDFTVPQRGDKLKLLDLSRRNAVQYKIDLEKQRTLVDPERHQKRVLNRLKSDLHMPVLPEVIECFDNSNFQGDYPVAAMVQFVNGKPNKSGYRHFNIKTVVGPDDYASMEEIVFRRYSRLIEEEKPLPQLIVVDGGKGQLHSALLSLEKLGLRGKITVVGIAERLEEIYFPDDPVPLYIDKHSESLRVIQFMRDEAHRFGITFHRKKFEKGFLHSELADIKGIGKASSEKLLIALKSVNGIKESSLERLAEVIGPAKAKLVFDHFHPQGQ